MWDEDDRDVCCEFPLDECDLHWADDFMPPQIHAETYMTWLQVNE